MAGSYILKRFYLGVRVTGATVPPGSNLPAVPHNDCSYRWIRTGQPNPLCR